MAEQPVVDAGARARPLAFTSADEDVGIVPSASDRPAYHVRADRRSFTEALAAAVVPRSSAATFLEASTVLQSRYGVEGTQRLDRRPESARIGGGVDPAQAGIP